MQRLARSLLCMASIGPVLCGLAACSRNYSPNVYAPLAAQQANTVDRGVIVGVRPVTISAAGTIGAVTGGAAGGVTGAHAATGAFASALGAIGGTLLGGLAGSAAERATVNVKAYEYIVQEKSGKLLSVTQTDKKPFAIGTHVLVITGKQARVIRDYTVALPRKPAPTAVAHEAPPIPVTRTELPDPLAPRSNPSGSASVAGRD